MGIATTPKHSGLREDAMPLTPPELIRLRKLLRQAEQTPEVGKYMDASELAECWGLAKRTVLDWAGAGFFDGPWGKAWKPAPNRLRIPLKGAAEFMERRQAAMKGVET